MQESTTPLAQPSARVDKKVRGSEWTPLRRREALTGYLFITPFVAFFVVFIAKAVFQSVYLSFFDYNPLKKNPPFIAPGNFQELFKDPLWWTSIRNTLLFAVLTVIGTTILGLFSAIAVNQQIRGRNIFRGLFYAPGLLSVGVVGITWAWLYDQQYGIINYVLHLLGFPPGAVQWLTSANMVLISLSLTTIWWTFGLPMLIFLAGLQNIPDQLYEAARIDGASPTQAFQYITLPLLRPTLLFVSVTGFISHLQVFGQAYIMPPGVGGPANASFTVIIYLWQEALRPLRMGYGSAVAVSLAVIIVLITLLQFRLLGRREA